MIYGYARVSTAEQNLDRQLEALKPHIKDERNIITDKASGKNFAGARVRIFFFIVLDVVSKDE